MLSRDKVVGHGVIDVGGDRKAATLNRGLVSAWGSLLKGTAVVIPTGNKLQIVLYCIWIDRYSSSIRIL